MINSYVYVSHPAQLNDPLDCNLGLAKIEDEENAKVIWGPLFKTVRQEYSKDIVLWEATSIAFASEIFSKWGVLALTDRSDNMEMWEKYAKNNGFCLEWDVSQFPFAKSGPFPIHYVQEIMEASSLKYNVATLALIQTNVKLVRWSYENEWRLMVHAPFGSRLKMYGRYSDCFNKTHPDAHDRKFKYPICALKSITLGVDFFKNIKDEEQIMLNPHNEFHACYKSVCNETKVLDFLDKLDYQHISVKVYLRLKDGFDSKRVPIIVEKISELTYRIIELKYPRNIVQNDAGKYAVLDMDGNTIVPFGKYDYIDTIDSHGLMRVYKFRDIDETEQELNKMGYTRKLPDPEPPQTEHEFKIEEIDQEILDMFA